MESNSPEKSTGIKLKFAALYILSLAIVSFIIYTFIPRSNAASSLVVADPLKTGNDYLTGDLMNKIELVNTKYLELKALDQQATDSAIKSNTNGQFIENNISNILDSLSKIARSTNSNQSLRLQKFIESYRLTLADRSAMNAYRTAVLSSGSINSSQKVILQLQMDLAAKNKEIKTLVTELNAVSLDKKPVANKNANQQAFADLTATITAQEKKIASLTADIRTLEREKTTADNSTKKGLDNESSLKSQNAALEQKISQLTAELRLTQADCNITRADASQIISNSKQRKALLSEALTILNGLTSNSDASTKNKVAEKLNRLNRVASTMRD